MENTIDRLIELSTEELHILFHQTNSAFSRNLINGAKLENERESIDKLNKICRLLNLRKGQGDEV